MTRLPPKTCPGNAAERGARDIVFVDENFLLLSTIEVHMGLFRSPRCEAGLLCTLHSRNLKNAGTHGVLNAQSVALRLKPATDRRR